MEPATGRTRDASRIQHIHMNRSVAEAARVLGGPDVRALIVVDGNDAANANVVGLLTERDIVRALATRGHDVYDLCVWLITDHDFPAIDIASSTQERFQVLCERKLDHIAIMDGFRVNCVLSIWDCAREAGVTAAPTSDSL